MKITHGHTTKATTSPTYKSWHMMKQRCTNKNYSQFSDYGGRGIAVCTNWLDFEHFLKDMGIRPDGTSLERKDNQKGYNKENCIWADKQTQQRNMRRNRNLTHNGETMCLSDWAARLDMKPHTLSMRIDVHGWSVEKALTTPPANCGRRKRIEE